MALPCTKVVIKRDDEDGVHYISKVPELEGCLSNGTTEIEFYLENCLIHVDPIPEPVIEESHN